MARFGQRPILECEESYLRAVAVDHDELVIPPDGRERERGAHDTAFLYLVREGLPSLEEGVPTQSDDDPQDLFLLTG